MREIKQRAGAGWLVFFLVMAVLLTLVVIILLPIISQTPQVYSDFVGGMFIGTNRSAEISLFWILLFVCLAVTAAAGWVRGRKAVPLAASEDKKASELLWAVCLLVFPNVLLLLTTGRPNVMLTLIAAFYFCGRAIAPACAARSALALVCSYYALNGILLAGLRFSAAFDRAWNGTRLLVISSLMAAGALALCFLFPRFLNRYILVSQCFAPLLLLSFIQDRYLYGEELVTVRYPAAYYVIVLGGVALAVGLALRQTIKTWRAAPNSPWAALVCAATPAILLIYNSYMSAARYFQQDTVHHGEQSVAWTQIVTFGQKAYDEYWHASGLYSMFTGFFQNVVLDGTVTAYPQATLLGMAVIAVATAGLCCLLAGRPAALLVGLFFSIPVYNRGYLLLPALLLLALPGLVRRRWLWLPAWVFCGFLGWLYYPLYGAALIAATLPFGLVQVVYFVRRGELRAAIRKPQTWLAWAAFGLPIIVSIPLLFRMVRQILTISGNSVLYEGIPIFGAPVQGNFLPYLEASFPGIRLGLFYGAKYVIPILSVAVFVLLTVLFVCRRTGKLLEHLSTPAFLFFSSGIGLLLGSYVYSIVREDHGMLLSRTSVILISAYIFLGIGLWLYGKTVLGASGVPILLALILGTSLVLYNTCPIVSFPGLSGSYAPNGGAATVVGEGDSTKLISANVVPEGFVWIDEETRLRLPNLGSGFIPQEHLESLLGLDEVFHPYIEQGYGIVKLPYQMFYQALGAKTGGTGLPLAQTESMLIDYLESHPKTVGLPLSALGHRSLVHYLIYEKDAVTLQGGIWATAQAVEQFGLEDRVIAETIPRSISPNLGNVPGNYGNSYEQLQALLSPDDAALVSTHALENGRFYLDDANRSVDFEPTQPISSANIDYLYLELDTSIDLEKEPGGGLLHYLTPNKKGETLTMSLYWASEEYPDFDEERKWNFNYVNGQLFIPLSAHPQWWAQTPTRLRLVFEDGFEAGATVDFERMELFAYNYTTYTD